MAQTVSEGMLDGRRVVVKQPNPGNQDTQLEVYFPLFTVYGYSYLIYIFLFHLFCNLACFHNDTFACLSSQSGQELTELSRLPSHPNVTPIIGVCLQKTYLAAIFPFMGGGYVSDYMHLANSKYINGKKYMYPTVSSYGDLSS